MEIDKTESVLETLSDRLRALDDSVPSPRTLFDVAGISRSESAWQYTLAYFLDPNEPHGFGSAILETFLTLVEEQPHSSFEFYEYNLEDIQIQVEASGDTGRPDIVLWLDEAWFLCIELKVDAPETEFQTERYTAASRFGDLRTNSIPPSGHHFVYLASRTASEPSADEFLHLTWQEVVSEFSSAFNSNIMTNPASSVAQLHDFVRHIKQELHMVSNQNSNPEKVELAFEHSETINELSAAAAEFIEEYQSSWDTRFEQNPPDGWTDEWTTIRFGNNWGRLVKTEWMLPENQSGEPKKTSGFSIAISIDMKRDDFERGETEAVLRVYGDNKYTDQYLDRFYSEEFQNRIRPTLQDTRLRITKPKSEKPIKSVHSFSFDNGAGHQAALKEIFKEYNEIAPYLEEIYFDIRSTIDDPNRLFEK